MNQLNALKQVTTVVADTGNFQQLAQYRPQDATTNPSLILKAVQQPQYAPLLHEVVQRFADAPLDDLMDRLLVRFGCEILAVVPGRVSTEVDARLSFDTNATVTRAQRLIDPPLAIPPPQQARAFGAGIDRIVNKTGPHHSLYQCGQRRIAITRPAAFAQLAAQVSFQLGRAGGEPGNIGQRQFIEPGGIDRTRGRTLILPWIWPGIGTLTHHLGHNRATVCRKWERVGCGLMRGLYHAGTGKRIEQ